MIMVIYSAILSLIMPMIVMIIANMMSKKNMKDREKISPFECGFDPKSSARMPFSLQFFLIAVIFLIFDVEIALILPIVIIMKMSTIYTWTLTTMFFLLILMVGIYHEWNQGSLQWAK